MNFIGVLGYSVVIPILVYIVNDLGGNPFIYGILGAMYPLFQFIGAPRLGALSDRIGRVSAPRARSIKLECSGAGHFLSRVKFVDDLRSRARDKMAQPSI